MAENDSNVEKWMAFEAEALPHMNDVFRAARWMAGERSIAEDLTQETFAEALKSFHRYQPDTNCRAWLMTILYRANGRRRAGLGRLKLVEDVEEQIASTVAFEPPIPQNLTDEDVISAVERVPQRYREAVLLSDVEQLSYKEVASVLDIPIGTVMSRIHRGRSMLRQELAVYARQYGSLARG